MAWKRGQKVRLVPMSEASGRTLEIYLDVERTLGLPHINTFFQAYGSCPTFLELFWTMAKPIVQTAQFHNCVHRLRADAYTRAHTYFQIPDLAAYVAGHNFSAGARQELTYAVDLFYYSVPITLALASMQYQAFDGPVGNPNAHREPAPPHNIGKKLILVDEGAASGPVRQLFDEIKRTTDSAVVQAVYRAFARWPDFLQGYWSALKPISQSVMYQHCERAIYENAYQVVQELPGPFELTSTQLIDHGVDEDDVASLVRITEMFFHSLCAALLNVAVAKIGMEGGSMTAANPEPSESPTAA